MVSKTTFCAFQILNDNTRIIVRSITDGLQLEAMISFCSLPDHQLPCKINDPVLVTKGQGQFSFQLETPPMCDCQRPLVAQASWQAGVYNYIQYGCGQVRTASQRHFFRYNKLLLVKDTFIVIMSCC